MSGGTSGSHGLAKWLRELWAPGETLSQRVAQGGFWVSLMRAAGRSFTVVRTVALARILAPHDFGVMGIAAMAMSALDMPTRCGFKEALIQSPRGIGDDLNTAWTISVLRGFVLSIVLFVAAPAISAFFDSPAAVGLMRAGSLCLLLDGLTNVGIVQLQRDLTYNKQFIYDTSGTVVEVITGITAAFVLRNAWALMIGRLARSLTMLVVSYLVHPHRPRIGFDLTRARDLYRFGRWMVASGLLQFLFTQGDDAFVGRLLTASSLGLYQMAYRVSNMPAEEMGEVIQRITFPAFSRVQDQLDKIREGYAQVLKVTSFFLVPVTGFFVALGADLTRIAFGESWMPMVAALRILALWALIRAVTGTTSPLLQAVGRPDLAAKILLARLVLLGVLLYPLTQRWQILGTALAVLISALPITLLTGHLAGRVLERPIWWLGRQLVVPLVAATVVSSGLMVSRSLLASGGLGVAGMLLLAALGAMAYAGFVQLLGGWLGVDYRIGGLLKDQITAVWRTDATTAAEDARPPTTVDSPS